MGEVVNVLVAFAVIIFLLKWVTSGRDSTERKTATDVLGFRPKGITPEMVNTLSAMFPDIPEDNLRYDLLRTGSVELTTNRILERGYLDSPPQAYYTLYPPQAAGSSPGQRTNNSEGDSGNSATSKKHLPKTESLISRYHLEDRIQRGESIADEEIQRLGGKAVWEDSPEKREANLRERKAKMVLAARQQILAKVQEEAEKGKTACKSSI